ncbi:MAG: hypothetical protein OXP71_07190 [Candidatus Poribacteria bacterium]|nr:hypothetical protein [Candidatus Poribacteria bacterium]
MTEVFTKEWCERFSRLFDFDDVANCDSKFDEELSNDEQRPPSLEAKDKTLPANQSPPIDSSVS